MALSISKVRVQSSGNLRPKERYNKRKRKEKKKLWILNTIPPSKGYRGCFNLVQSLIRGLTYILEIASVSTLI
jgi:hypothetical protein